MRTLLFVDDDELVLKGLKTGMRLFRGSWNASFADGADSALQLLEAHEPDVVISDMRMPGMDGASLLAVVKERYPSTVRMILSGYSEMEAVVRAVPVAHQFLTKPCTPTELIKNVERALELRTLVEDRRIRAAVGAVDSLPVVPSMYTELTRLLAKPEADAEHVAELVEQDPALSSKILQLVNSSFFAPAMPIASIQLAVVRLGYTLIKNLALTAQLFQEAELQKLPQRFSLESLQRHAMTSAWIARKMFSDRAESDQASTAALLHSTGKLILASRLSGPYGQVLDIAAESDKPLHEVEKEELGVTNGEVGAYLLAMWGLPYAIVEAVAHHASPGSVMQDSFGALGAAHVASVLAYDLEPTGPIRTHPMDESYLNKMGVAEEAERWRKSAGERAAKQG